MKHTYSKTPHVTKHPLIELIASSLSGLSVVPPEVQRRMVRDACVAAAKWHDAIVEEIRKEPKP